MIKKKKKKVKLNRSGAFTRYKFPVLTSEHVPLNWRYDLNEKTNPFLLERLGINAVHGFIAVVDERHFVGTHDLSVLVDPDTGGHVDHAIQCRNGVLFVHQHGVGGLGLLDPRSGIFNPSDVFRHRDDLKVLGFVFLVEFLPAWQIEAAASPGGPGDQQHSFAAEIAE